MKQFFLNNTVTNQIKRNTPSMPFLYLTILYLNVCYSKVVSFSKGKTKKEKKK